MWRPDDIARATADALRAEARRWDDEQSPYGLDALDEVSLHPVLARGLADAGFTPLAEQRYPSHRARRRRHEGERCDLVLVPDGADHLRDPLAADTLFGERGADPADAAWIEVKTAHQFAVIGDAAAGPNPAYSSQLLSAATADLRKLAHDPLIRFGGLLLLQFTLDESTARHDLAAWLNRCLDHDLPISSPASERFAVTDRVGNGLCTITLVPIRATRDHPAPARATAQSIKPRCE